MSKPANKTMIGAFVLAGVGLAIASVIILGSGKFFTKVFKYDVFFKGSVKGLQVGSPVMFRGVKLGEVTAIRLYLNVKDLSVVMPVEIAIDPANFASEGGLAEDRASRLQPLIDKGLRAQLQMSSMVTGQQMVYLDFFPDSPVELLSSSKAIYPEIPAIQSDSQALLRKFEDLPLKEIAVKIDSALNGIDRLVNSPELVGSVGSARKLIKHVDELVEQNRNFSYQTSRTLDELSDLTRSLNSLSRYLSVHPEAVLWGKRQTKGE